MKKPSPPKPLQLIPFLIAEDPVAKAEWVRVFKCLCETVDERDRSLLIDYCRTISEIEKLRDLVDVEGYSLIGEKGGAYTNPTVNTLTSRMSHLAQLRRDMYFTPRSRIEKANKSKTASKATSIRNSVKDQDDDES